MANTTDYETLENLEISATCCGRKPRFWLFRNQRVRDLTKKLLKSLGIVIWGLLIGFLITELEIALHCSHLTKDEMASKQFCSPFVGHPQFLTTLEIISITMNVVIASITFWGLIFYCYHHWDEIVCYIVNSPIYKKLDDLCCVPDVDKHEQV